MFKKYFLKKWRKLSHHLSLFPYQPPRTAPPRPPAKIVPKRSFHLKQKNPVLCNPRTAKKIVQMFLGKTKKI